MKNKNIIFYLKTTLLNMVIYFILRSLGEFSLLSFIGGMIYFQICSNIRENHLKNVQD